MRQLIILSVLGLAACGQPAITTPPVAMDFTSSAAQTSVDTYDLVSIRSFTGLFTNQRAVNGASCEVFGDGYSATFKSPSILQLPLYRGRTSDVRVVCNAKVGGIRQSGAKTVEATNLTAPEGEGVTISVGTGGTNIGAVFSIRDRARDRFDYPRSVTVRLQ